MKTLDAATLQQLITSPCWLCEGMGGIAPHLKWSEKRGKTLWTAHTYPSDDPHPTYPCPACSRTEPNHEAA